MISKGINKSTGLSFQGEFTYLELHKEISTLQLLCNLNLLHAAVEGRSCIELNRLQLVLILIINVSVREVRQFVELNGGFLINLPFVI